MNPLFKLTTPNGKYKIEGYAPINKFHYQFKLNGEDIYLDTDDLKANILREGYEKIKVPNITEEMAKSWGYEELKTNTTIPTKIDEVGMLVSQIRLISGYKGDLSNVVLILKEQ